MELKIELIIFHFVVKNLHNRISTVFSQTQLITNYLEKIFEFWFPELLGHICPFLGALQEISCATHSSQIQCRNEQKVRSGK